MKRPQGDGLVANEIKVLAIAVELKGERFHGYELVTRMKAARSSGGMDRATLYRVLRRLEARGLVKSEWESREDAVADGRTHPRCYHWLSAEGERVAREAAASRQVPAWSPPRLADGRGAV
jgi:DNA-binding PadR family transcriptional regulator